MLAPPYTVQLRSVALGNCALCLSISFITSPILVRQRQCSPLLRSSDSCPASKHDVLADNVTIECATNPVNSSGVTDTSITTRVNLRRSTVPEWVPVVRLLSRPFPPACDPAGPPRCLRRPSGSLPTPRRGPWSTDPRRRKQASGWNRELSKWS